MSAFPESLNFVRKNSLELGMRVPFAEEHGASAVFFFASALFGNDSGDTLVS